MAQYTTITSTAPLVISDGVDTYRYSVNGDMYLQQSVGGIWEDIEQYTDSGDGTWRVGVRDAHWVMDCAITATGFNGTIDVDWELHEQHQL